MNDIEKQKRIGNTILYLCKGVSSMSKTKLLKLLYLLEERSFLLFGTPFLGLDFEVWKLGPVPKEIYGTITESDCVHHEWLYDYVPLSMVRLY